jgi:hypothetical protein
MRDAIVRAGELLLAMQTRDGALPLGAPGAPERRVVTYFGHLGARGLVLAYQAAGDRRFLDAVRHWVEWVDARRNPDGTVYDYTGREGAWKATGDYDSTDSYASTYLELMDTLARAPLPEGDRRWLLTRRSFARRSVDAMLLTLQKQDLTTAKPTWPVMYTMDNVEVLRGLRAGEHFLGGDAPAARCREMAPRVEVAIANRLWDAGNGCYLVGLQTDGGRMTGLEKWYPDIMANLMAIGWLPPDASTAARNRVLYRRLAASFADAPETGIPAEAKGEGDLEHLAWWGFAARTAGDTARLANIRAALARAVVSPDRHYTNPATLGHTCRLLGVSNSKDVLSSVIVSC